MTEIIVSRNLLLQDLAGVEHVVKNLVNRLYRGEHDEDDAGVYKPNVPDKRGEILERVEWNNEKIIQLLPTHQME